MPAVIFDILVTLPAAEPKVPRIDFYILPDTLSEARDRFCCRLAAKAWRDGHSVFIRTGSEAQAEQIDQLLWTHNPSSFIPHGRDSDDGETPIVIATSTQPGDLVINLAEDLPPDWNQRGRVAEILTADPINRDAGRQRYRQYQQAGTKPFTHQIADQELS